jgi:nucleotide-binding universal stress UspA family protein
MKTIVVATDFSPAALNAAYYAVNMATAINAGIFILHVYEQPVIYSEVPLTTDTEQALQKAGKEIEKIKDLLTSKTNKKIHMEAAVIEGVFFDKLKEVCEQIHPYTVVMGTQVNTAAERLLFGTHAAYATRHLPWPLITVPVEAKFMAIKKIALACDFDNVTDTVPVEEIKMLIEDFNAELHILNAGKEEVFNSDIVFQSGLLKEMLEGIPSNYHFISSKNTDESIISFVENNKIDLLVVLPKRHSLFDKLLHKSHTKQLVLHSHVPVMAMHFVE